MDTRLRNRLVFGTIAFLCLLSGCSREPSGPPASALVLTFTPHPGWTGPTAHYLTDTPQIARLETFFPRYRTHPSSNIAAAWVAGYQVYFNFPHGQTIRIMVSADDHAAFWTAGHGDFNTNGDFKAFVGSLPR